MTDSYQIDYLDREILDYLLKDARVPYKFLATELKVSNSLIHQRIRKMTESGLITGSGIRVNRKGLGYTTSAFIGIVLTSAKKCNYVTAKLQPIKEIVECNLVTGKHAIFIKVVAKDNDHLRDIIFNKIHLIDGVSSTDTITSFETTFRRNITVL